MMAWGVPPPPPPRPASLANLSLDELQRMEGTERRNVEARLQLLRDIQAMLDASVLLMQQYSAVVSNLPQNYNNVATQTEVNQTETTPESSPSPAMTKSEPDVVPSTSGIPKPSTSSATNSQDSIKPDTSTTNATSVSDKDDADAEELRRRRLQKFITEN